SHQRGDTFLTRQIDERAVLQQELDERGIACPCCAQQRGCSLGKYRVSTAILRHVPIRRATFELKSCIRSLLEEHSSDVERSHRILTRDDGHRAVTLHRQRADVSRHVQGRTAEEIPFVDIRAGFDHVCGKLEVKIEQRHVQRGYAVRIFQIRVGSGRYQVPCALDASFARGIEQRRETTFV